MKRALFFYNPNAGRSSLSPKRRQKLIESIHGLGLEVTSLCSSPAPGALSSGHLENQDLIIVYGGDGTIHQALGPALDLQLPVAVLPGGTANVLARELSIPRDPARALRLLKEGKRTRMRLGKSGPNYFHLMAGVGLDSHIIDQTSSGLKRRFGVGSYWLAGLRAFRNVPLQPFEIYLDDGPVEATFAVISNSRFYGGHLLLAPAADVTQDCLDVCLFTSRDRKRYVTYLMGVLTGRHVGLPDVHYVKAKEISVRGEPSIPVQMDGEVIGTLPMDFEVARRSVEIFVPRTR